MKKYFSVSIINESVTFYMNIKLYNVLVVWLGVYAQAQNNCGADKWVLIIIEAYT